MRAATAFGSSVGSFKPILPESCTANFWRVYANMDLFVFPSETDTYGNVVAEARASGVPAVVTSKGGPKYQVRDGVTGLVAADTADFIAKVKLVLTVPKVHMTLRENTRAARGPEWGSVTEDLQKAYRRACSLPPCETPKRLRAAG